MTKIVILCLHDKSWGRLEMATTMAADMRRAGFQVLIVADTGVVNGLKVSDVDVRTVHVGMGGLLRLYIDSLVQSFEPSWIIHCDYFNNVNYFHRCGETKFTFMAGYPARVAMIDTWDHSITGFDIDDGAGTSRSVVLDPESNAIEVFEAHDVKLYPIPFQRIAGRSGEFRAVQHHADADIGTVRVDRPASGDSKKSILFCTASWQHADDRSSPGRVVVPSLLFRQLRLSVDSFRLVHVGPVPYDLESSLQCEYQWRPPVSSSELESLFRHCDLLISLNAVSYVNIRAMTLGVPVLLFINSQVREVSSSPDVSSEGREPPIITPFVMWPVGYFSFLAPMIDQSDYFHSLQVEEIGDDTACQVAINELLFDAGKRRDRLAKQMAYLASLESVPTIDTVLTGMGP